MKKIISLKKSTLVIISVFLAAVIGILAHAQYSYSEIERNIVNYKLQKKSQGRVNISAVSLNNLEMDEWGAYEKSSKRQIYFHDNPISQLQFSPSGKMFGFLENRDIYDEKIPDNEEVIFYLGETGGKDYKEVYHGSYHTSGWEWLNENEVVIYTSCGTECEVAFLYDARNPGEAAELWAVGYEWSPDKQMILSYYYALGYGVGVQNKKGEDIFLITRKYSEPYSELANKTIAVWSPDSTKLVLVIKKEKEDKMEFLAYDIKNGFKRIYQGDIPNYIDGREIRWSADSKHVFHGDLVVNLDEN